MRSGSRSRPQRPAEPGARQRGAAVLLALFVVVLATLIVTDLFWRQFVIFRTVENEQAAAQAQFLLHGALDWARVLLQDQPHPTYDTLSDPWAQPLAQTQLDQLGETAVLAAQATMEGGIEDAEARFNLRNLVDGTGHVVPAQLAILEKLAVSLGAPSGTAQLVAQYVAMVYTGVTPLATPSAPVAGSTPTVAVSGVQRPLPPVFPEDLAAVPGVDPGAAAMLAAYVVMLDQGGTNINFNTASAAIMAAAIPGLSISDANALAAERDRAYFTSVGDLQNRLNGRGGATALTGIAVNSQYFIVRGTVRLQHAATQLRALVRRNGSGAPGSVQVLWESES